MMKSVSNAFLGMVILNLVACARGSEIRLKNENLNTNPSPVLVPKPGDGIDPSGGDADQGSRVGYRIFCEAFDGPQGVLVTGSTQASAATSRLPLSIVDATNSRVLVVAIRNLLPLGKFQRFQGRFVFEGEGLREGSRSTRQIYIGEINVADREGSAKAIAQVPAVDPGAVALATRLQVNLRSFGRSSHNTWVIIPEDGRLSLRRADDLSVVGVLDLPARQTFFPALDEESGFLSFTSFEQGRFVNRLVRLAVKTARPATIVRNIDLPVPPVAWTALPIEVTTDGYVWSERPIAAPESNVAMVRSEPGKTPVRSVYSLAGPAVGRVRLPTAFYKFGKFGKSGQSGIAMVVALEEASRSSTTGHLALLKAVGEDLKVVNEWIYPAGALATLSELVASPDHGSWIGLMTSDSGENFVVRAEGEAALVKTGSGSCRAPALIPEEL